MQSNVISSKSCWFIYIVNISYYIIAKLPSITNIYWGDTNDSQQAITRTDVN